MSSETDSASSTIPTSESTSMSSEYPSENETTETPPEPRKKVEKESDTGTGSSAALSGSDAPSSSSDHDKTTSQTENSPARSEQAPQSILDTLKSDAEVWPQFCALAEGFGMTPELFEKYLGTVQENTCNNAELRADICAKTDGEAERNPELMHKLLTVCVMQQVLNPVNILQFLAQNSNNSSQQPDLPTPKAVHEEEITAPKKTANETAESPVKNDRGQEKKKPTYAELVHEAWEKFIKPTIQPFFMADSYQLSYITYREIPYRKQTQTISNMTTRLENIERWDKVFMENGNLNLSDEDILNYVSQKEIPVPDIEKLKKNRKIVKFKPTFLGMKKSLKKLCIHCTTGARPEELILLPPASADKPICARICFQSYGYRPDFYMIGENTCIKAKDDYLFRFGLGLSKQIFVSGVRFLNNVFPRGRGFRSVMSRDHEYGRVFFVKCTFDEPLFIQSDVFLIDCKGKELTIFDQLVARCIRCEFDVVHVVGGLLVAKECRIGRMERHVSSDYNDGRVFRLAIVGGGEREEKTKPIWGDSKVGSYFVLDRCNVGEDVKVPDEKNMYVYGTDYTNPWTLKTTGASVREALEKHIRSLGWHGASSPACHLLRNVKICTRCYGNNRCIKCRTPLDVGYYGKTISFCQFCITGSHDLPEDLAVRELAECVCHKCALCGELDTCDERGLNYPGMLCTECARGFDSCHCLICGKAHGDSIGV